MVFTDAQQPMDYIPQPAFPQQFQTQQEFQQPQQVYYPQTNFPQQQQFQTQQVTTTEQKSFVTNQPTMYQPTMYQPSPAVPVTISETTTYMQPPPMTTVQVITTRPADTSYKVFCVFGVTAMVVSLITWFLGFSIFLSLVLVIVAQIFLWMNYAKHKQSPIEEAAKYAKMSMQLAVLHIILLVVLISLQVMVVVGVVVIYLIIFFVAFGGAAAAANRLPQQP